MLHEQIKEQVKQAMLAKDPVRVTTLRSVVAACMNELVAKKRKPQEILSDEEVVEVIRRSVKQRKDSIDQFTKGGRPDLAEGEIAELQVLEAYLPTMMSLDEIRVVAQAKKLEMGEIDKSKMGQFMGAVMKDLKGKADGSDVKAVIEEMFQ